MECRDFPSEIPGTIFRVDEDLNIYGKYADPLTPYKIHPKAGVRAYYIVATTYNGEKFQEYVHRLYAMAFIPNPDDLPLVMHLNGDTLDNRVENLAWVDYSDRCKLAWSNAETTVCRRCGKTFKRLKHGDICGNCYRLENGVNARREKKIAYYKPLVDPDKVKDPRAADMIRKRAEGKALQSIADDWGVTRERVRRIIAREERRERNKVDKVIR